MIIRWICLVVTLSGVFSPAFAQRPSPILAERHTKRILAVSNISLLDSKEPISTTGGFFQISLKKTTVNRSINPSSLLQKIDGAYENKLAPGTVDGALRRELAKHFINISANATLEDSNDVWLLTDGPNKYSLFMVDDKLGVFADVTKEEIVLPKFYLHLLGAGSLNGENDYTVLGQVGLMRRNRSTVFTTIGVAAQGSMPIKGIASVVRLEIYDVLAFQGGPGYYEDNGWGYYISVDFVKGLWQDIGLK